MNTLKELATLAIDGIKTQGDLAYDPSKGECQLRTATGLKCAVGMLIEDQHYVSEMEIAASPHHRGSRQVREAIAVSNPTLNLDAEDWHAPYWTMLTKLQDAHDHSIDVPDFINNAKQMLSEQFGVVL